MRLYKRGGGMWWCRVRDARGRIVRKSTHCRDYDAALVAAREYEKQGADPAYAKAAASTLSQCIEAYFDDQERRGNAEGTFKKQRTKLGHFLRLWPADLPMTAVTSGLVEAYIKTREGEHVTRHTVKMELQALTGVLKVARHDGTLHTPIEQILPILYGSKHKPKERAPTLTEVRALIDQFHRHRGAHLAYFVATGCRLSESYRARRSHFDPARGVVFLEGRKTAKSKGEIPVTVLTAPYLLWSLENAPGRDLLFQPWGKLHRDVAAACVRAGIEKVTPNDLRRAFGTIHAEAGLTPKQVSELLRHATDKLAQTTYARLNADQIGQLINAKLGVPVLYLNAAQTGASSVNELAETSEKAAPPGVVETPTNALGKRSLSARSLGNYRAWEKRRAVECVDSDRHPPLEIPAVDPSPAPWVREAAGVLEGLLVARSSRLRRVSE